MFAFQQTFCLDYNTKIISFDVVFVEFGLNIGKHVEKRLLTYLKAVIGSQIYLMQDYNENEKLEYNILLIY